MMKKFTNIIKRVFGGAVLVLYGIFLAGISGEIYDEFDFEDGIAAGIYNIFTKLLSDETYIVVILYASMIYTFVRLLKWNKNLTKKIEKAD